MISKQTKIKGSVTYSRIVEKSKISGKESQLYHACQ